MIRGLLLLAAFFWATAGLAANPAVPHKTHSNAEMAAMFDADQAARNVANIDWTKLLSEDETRLKRTRALLDSGGLQSGDDYFHAAFIFQHGGEPNDYLLAHILAVAAIKRGRNDASWIASATLDRYLQSIGQPQVLGTQYRCRDGQPLMEPYRGDLVPDSTRVALGVPVRAEQRRHGESLCGPAPDAAPAK